MPVYLRQEPSGELYIYTDELAKRPDMTQLTAKEAAGYLAAASRKRNEANKPAPAPEVKAAPKAKKKAAPKKVPKKPKLTAEEAEAQAQQELELELSTKAE